MVKQFLPVQVYYSYSFLQCHTQVWSQEWIRNVFVSSKPLWGKEKNLPVSSSSSRCSLCKGLQHSDFPTALVEYTHSGDEAQNKQQTKVNSAALWFIRRIKGVFFIPAFYFKDRCIALNKKCHLAHVKIANLATVAFYWTNSMYEVRWIDSPCFL